MDNRRRANPALIREFLQPFWSTYRYKSKTPLANRNDDLFAAPLGAAGQGFARSTVAETNMIAAGRLPGGLAFDCHILGCEFLDAPALKLAQSCVPSWRFLQTMIDTAPVSAWAKWQNHWLFTLHAPPPELLDVLKAYCPDYDPHEKPPEFTHLPVTLPADAAFCVRLRWGQHAPTPDAPFRVRVTIYGRAYFRLNT